MVNPPFDFLESFRVAHEKMGWDHAVHFDHWFTNGYLFKGPTYLMMGGDDPTGRTDAWFVWWAEAHPITRSDQHMELTLIRHFLRLMPYPRPYVCFGRGLRGRHSLRYYSTERLMRLTGISHGQQTENTQHASTPGRSGPGGDHPGDQARA